MTNQSLRERFQISQKRIHLVSGVIAAALEDGWIKLDQKVGTSKKLARYVPAWI
jgi:ATP-dependent DNA helicase RecG